MDNSIDSAAGGVAQSAASRDVAVNFATNHFLFKLAVSTAPARAIVLRHPAATRSPHRRRLSTRLLIATCVGQLGRHAARNVAIVGRRARVASSHAVSGAIFHTAAYRATVLFLLH